MSDVAAKSRGTPLNRLHMGCVDFCYRVPYHRNILELWTNYGLAAFGLNILGAAQRISAMAVVSQTKQKLNILKKSMANC